MSRLFISLYLDEDVSVLLAKLVRSRAFVAVTTQEANQLGNPDAEQLRFAATQQMAVLTHNRADFEALARQYEMTHANHSSIIIAVRRPLYKLAHRVLELLNQHTAEEMDN